VGPDRYENERPRVAGNGEGGGGQGKLCAAGVARAALPLVFMVSRRWVCALALLCGLPGRRAGGNREDAREEHNMATSAHAQVGRFIPRSTSLSLSSCSLTLHFHLFSRAYTGKQGPKTPLPDVVTVIPPKESENEAARAYGGEGAMV